MVAGVVYFHCANPYVNVRHLQTTGLSVFAVCACARASASRDDVTGSKRRYPTITNILLTLATHHHTSIFHVVLN